MLSCTTKNTSTGKLLQIWKDINFICCHYERESVIQWYNAMIHHHRPDVPHACDGLRTMEERWRGKNIVWEFLKNFYFSLQAWINSLSFVFRSPDNWRKENILTRRKEENFGSFDKRNGKCTFPWMLDIDWWSCYCERKALTAGIDSGKTIFMKIRHLERFFQCWVTV